MKRIVNHLILTLVLTVVVACGGGGSGTTIVGNPTSASTVTIGQLSGEQSTVTIPLSVFETTPTISVGLGGRWLTGGSPGANASESSLTGATIDIEINGVLTNEGISAADNYQESLQSVVFVLASLQDGDVLTIIVHKNDGTEVSFTGEVSADEETEVVSDFGTLEGAAALADRDLASAVDEYCGAYENGDTDSSTAFGCYLAKAMSLPETNDFAAVLDDFGEDHVDVAEEILSDVVDDVLGDDGEDTGFIYANYEVLPFSSYLSGDGLVGERFAELTLALNATGTAAEALQTDVEALYDDFEELEDLLAVVIADGDFVFEIPADLFGTETNVVVDLRQAYLHMGSVQGVLVGLDVFASYDFGFTAADVVQSGDADFDYEVLVADLNGTGETVNGIAVDTTPFLTIADAARITGAADRASQAIDNLITGLSQYDADATGGDFAWEAAEHVTAGESVEFLIDLQNSLDNDTMVDLGGFKGRNVSVNLREFFDNPPSAADVTDADPFVFEDGAIMMVESYFQDLLEGIAEFGE